MKIPFLIIFALAWICPVTHAADSPRPDANMWLDRAIAELPGVRKESEEQNGKRGNLENWLSEEVFAVSLFDLRPDHASRDRLLEIARRVEKTIPVEGKAAVRFSAINAAATLYAYAGARNDVHRLLPLLEKIDAKADSLVALSLPITLATIREKIGELNAAELEKLSVFYLSMLMNHAAEDGRPNDAARYLRQARKAVEAPAVKDSVELELLAASAAKSGQIAAAMEIAREIPTGDYQRPRAFTGMALARLNTGDAAGCLQSLNEALAAVPDFDQTLRLESFTSILDAAIAANEKAIISRSVDGMWAAINAGGGGNYQVSYLAQIATACALTGRRADFTRAINAAQAAVSKVPIEERPAYQIKVAAAYARAGDKASAQAAAVKAKSLGKLRDVDLDEYESLADAYADDGDFTSALTILKTNLPKPEDQIFCLQRIAWRQIQSSHYADAEKTAALIQDPFRQFIVHRWIVTERTRRADSESLQKWIASHPSARQRAALYLAIAQQLLGRGDKGNTMVYKPPF